MSNEIKDILKSMSWGILLLCHLVLFVGVGAALLVGDWKPKYTQSLIPVAQRSLDRFLEVDARPLESFGKREDYPQALENRRMEAYREAVHECHDCSLWLIGVSDVWRVKMKLEALTKRKVISSYYRWFYIGKFAQLILTSIGGFWIFVLWRARKVGIFPYFAVLSFASPLFALLVPFANVWFEDIYMTEFAAFNERTFGFLVFAGIAPFVCWPPVFVIAKRRRQQAAP